MPEAEDFIDYALAQSGKPYHAYGNRFGPDYYDCSGLVIASLRHAGVDVPFPQGTGNTVSLYNWGREVGGLVSVAKGVSVRGAIMIKGRWYGNGPLGHTSFSLGNGREMAAHGTFSGIHESDLYGGKNYQDAFIIPGVHYASLDPPVDPKVLAALAKLEQWKAGVSQTPLRFGTSNYNVGVLNELLRHRAYMPWHDASGNTYTKRTRQAVRNFKTKNGWKDTNGKVFGGPAAAVLLAP